MKLLILNGPNLNLLGRREPEIYGYTSFDQHFTELVGKFPEIELQYYQSNHEGNIIDKIQEVGFSFDGIILNAGGYSHTSIAIHDAIKAVTIPVIEVHISNIYAREEFRRKSILSLACQGVISGLGMMSYELAIRYLNERKNND